MNEAVLNLITTVLAAVATGAVTVAVAFLQSRLRSERTGEALARLEEAAAITVGELQQTVVEGWKAAGGGKLTRAQMDDLRGMVLDKARQKLDKPAIALLEGVGADVSALIMGCAEDAVRKMKE